MLLVHGMLGLAVLTTPIFKKSLFTRLFFFLVTFKEKRCQVLDRFIGMPGNMELAERAAGDNHFCPGLFNLLTPAFTECCCFIREPGSYPTP